MGTRSDHAYLAGIIDGEGSIGLYTSDRARRVGEPVVTVDSTDREVLDWLKMTFGGSIVVKRKQRPHHRQAWTWRVKNRKAVALLALALPYLRIDRKRVRALLLVEEHERCTPRNGHYTPELRAAKDDLLRRFRAA